MDYVIQHSEASIVFAAASKLPVLALALPQVLPQVRASKGALEVACCQPAVVPGLDGTCAVECMRLLH